jgi:transcription elongation factor Elf1
MPLPSRRYRYFHFLADYDRYRCNVAIRCPKCGHTITVAIEKLHQSFGPVRTKDAAKRLVCTECGTKGAELAPVPAG